MPAGAGAEERAERFRQRTDASAARLAELKEAFAQKRAAYIASGVLPDPERPGLLEDAAKLVGTCEDMCPEYERLERELQNELDRLEVYPGTQKADPAAAVKIYRRPAAGRELPLPEEVRPARVLKGTLDYLFHTLLPREPSDPRFAHVQPFLWNRTRAVRQDFIVQSDTGLVAIACHERIARYHILCLHYKGGGVHAEAWSEQQELEQLRKTLRSLIEYYDDQRLLGTTCPHEPEFRAYNLLLHARDPEALREIELLPAHVFRAAPIQRAVHLRTLAQRANLLEKRGTPPNTEAAPNFFTKFFATLRADSTPYLVACLAEQLFPSVRIGAIKTLARAYMTQHMGLPLAYLTRALAMDSNDACAAFLTTLGVDIEHTNGAEPVAKVNKATVLDEDKSFAAPFTHWIETKRHKRTCQAIVDEPDTPHTPAPPDPQRTAPAPEARPPPPTLPPHGAPLRTMSCPAAAPAAGPPQAAAVSSERPQHARPTHPRRPPTPPPPAPLAAAPRPLPTPPLAAPGPWTTSPRRPAAHSAHLVHPLIQRLCTDVATAGAHAAAHAAAKAEDRRRRQRQRAHLIDQLATQLLTALHAAPAAHAAHHAACTAAAATLARRHTLRRALAHWRRVRADACDRATQSARLCEIRARLATVHPAGVRAALKPLPVRHTQPLAPTDAARRQAFRRAAQHRERLWRPGTFAHALLTHLDALAEAHAPPPHAHYTACVSLPDSHPAADWLRRKWALEDTPAATYDVGKAACATNATATLTTDLDPEAGLVVFACADAASDDRARLRSVQAHAFQGARLLLLAWTRAQVHTLLPVLSRPAWQEVRVLLLDDAARDADAAWAHALAHLLPYVVWRDAEAPTHASLAPLLTTWRAAAQALARIVADADAPTAAHGWALLTALTRRLLQHACTACDAPPIDLPCPHAHRATDTPRDLALRQLDALPPSSGLALLRADVARATGPLALTTYMEQVVACLLAPLGEAKHTPPPDAVAELEAGGQDALTDLAARVAPVVPAPPATPPKKRTRTKSPPCAPPKRPARPTTAPASHAPPSAASERATQLAKLRRLMASTQRLLHSPS